MAYSCVRVQFEVGHEASIRNKRTPDGFTHDWEVFVRGADNAEIHNFVDKVVFHLHETFPKPKRVVKEPPYVVKESGYAGFNLPIDIYVKTKEEGSRKIRLYYDLTLQPLGTGSARISNVTREKHDFTNPAEDLRRKLLRGGGCGVGSDGIASSDKVTSGSSSNNVSNSLNSNSNHLDDSKNSPHSTSKGKGSGGEPPAKKHKAAKEPKTEESRLTNSFAELFGTPIKTVKHSPNPKPPPKPPSESSKSHDKDKCKEPSSKVPKHSPAKEKDKEKSEKDRERRDKESEKSTNKEKERSSKDKDGHKDGEKSKDKSRKSGSSSSSLFSQKDFVKKEEDRGKKAEDVKEKEKSSSKGETSTKSEKKHEEKKSRDEKEKKDKHKKEVIEKKEVKEVEKEKPVEKKHEVVKEVVKESKDVGGGKHKVEKEEKKSKSAEKSKEKNNTETEKPKHKHKKKDKHRKDEEREKPRKKDKEKEKEVVGGSNAQEVPKGGGKVVNAMPPPLTVKEKTPPSSPPPPAVSKPSHPLKELLDELTDQGSDSDFSGTEDAVKQEVKEKSPSPPPAPVPPPPPPPPPPVKIKEEKKVVEVPKEERPEKSKKRDRKGKDEDHRKRKRKHKDRDSSREEPQDKAAKLMAGVTIKEEKMSPTLSSESRQSRSPSPEETLFTEDYINQLKDLQHKIMTLQDNADLQKVVQVISETGQFEITQRTFDFDLCALDPSTVKMLQDMFISA